MFFFFQDGQAVHDACVKLKERLNPYYEILPKGTSMKEIATKANFDRVDLTGQSYYKVNVNGFNFDTQSGEPYHYYTTGVACSEVEIDTLTGKIKKK